MQPRPPFDRELLIPIAVGVVAILGIGWILSTSDLSQWLIRPTAEPTAVLLDAAPLEIKTLASPLPATRTPKKTTPTTIGTSPDVDSELPVETTSPVSTVITRSQQTPSATSTPEDSQSFTAGKYDDTHPGIAYDRYWAFERSPGTKYAYQGTLHISVSMWSEATFRFTGRRLNLGYQRGRSFGIVTVLIDDQPYRFHEQAFDKIWRSPELSSGTHDVRIVHESGASVNLDYIEVVE